MEDLSELNDSPSCAIIREIYDSENSHEQFELDLENALEARYDVIVIEPASIGDETSRWITVGNCLHKTAVIAGIGCLFSPLFLPTSWKVLSFSSGAVSVTSASIYGLSWQFDPCCKYQLERDSLKLAKLALPNLTSSSPVILVRKDDSYRKKLQNFFAIASACYCALTLYKWLRA
ncbi:uncharacterized protein TRIADDRAFT_52909 [Trichoplax adhaerens]|uniref:Transmembrane protein 11, mitochondrial n=1 Tax=Trichoplax adhaerens TaxID=10228 RepID=B3RMS8_TRIAD|nr:hypothetical protein TRIADDRAFT_52909 [Trichoplax adhaerens]EDV27901.1 hypothetical protein TRIADDRAFT_52909 [Trichoplax adhaerens]|eukprot:XP_002109735.1 hypothetical protein TRIADDRAFT_52909 [Trichoplax adhaerens]